MSRFPKREADVIVLADSMIAGYAANPGVFPNANPTLASETALTAQPRNQQLVLRHRHQRRRGKRPEQYAGGGAVVNTKT